MQVEDTTGNLKLQKNRTNKHARSNENEQMNETEETKQEKITKESFQERELIWI
jgi:hypothetical protein